ncbi:transporter RarD family, DMT superfamily protein [Thalassobaculum fulvum]|uniref:Transporter RarD family, DMT superfamily protein n=1 Tax=Thalassobaculum fulvum TaxID=1633335 RepID=A0A918XUA4_9PROT|nr:DMT family transporter [Thalassobaculum fulvum]GHD56792.1 transporter RarD family, DMT superfamily protein [Thalassobaculum fulvum]
MRSEPEATAAPTQPGLTTPASPTAAALLMLTAAALVAVTTLLAKALGRGVGGEPLPPFMVSGGRFAFAWLTLLPFVAWMRPSFEGAAWKLHAARSFCGWAGVSGMFAAAAVLPLADATAISFLNPMIAMVLAIPLLGERIGPWRWGAAATALLGAVVLIRPGLAAFQPYSLVALAAAVFMAFEVVVVKMLAGGSTKAGEPPIRILFINNSIGATISLAAAATVWVWPSPAQWPMLAAIGVVMLSVQALFIQALKRADASFVMPFFYATLIFASAYDAAVFGDLPTALSVLGAALIVAGAAVLAWRERVRQA